jgi:hypothetical protein
VSFLCTYSFTSFFALQTIQPKPRQSACPIRIGVSLCRDATTNSVVPSCLLYSLLRRLFRRFEAKIVGIRQEKRAEYGFAKRKSKDKPVALLILQHDATVVSLFQFFDVLSQSHS